MSVTVQALVWKYAPYSEGTLLVLLALADWSNDEGESWPAIPSIATKTRQSDRQTQRCIKLIKKDGFLTVKRGGGKGISNRYCIAIEKLADLNPVNVVKPKTKRVTKRHPLDGPAKGDIGDTETVTLEAPKGDIGDTQRVTPMSPDPLIEPPVLDPPKEPSMAAALKAARLTDTRRLLAYLARKSGPIANTMIQAKAIGWLLDHGYDAEQCISCLDYLLTDKSQKWRTTAVTWLTVQKEIGGWLKRNGATEATNSENGGTTTRLRKGLNEQ